MDFCQYTEEYFSDPVAVLSDVLTRTHGSPLEWQTILYYEPVSRVT